MVRRISMSWMPDSREQESQLLGTLGDTTGVQPTSTTLSQRIPTEITQEVLEPFSRSSRSADCGCFGHGTTPQSCYRVSSIIGPLPGWPGGYAWTTRISPL